MPIVEPPDIAAICNKPGAEWTEAECRRFAEWLMEDRQQRYLLGIIAWSLAPYGTVEDIEEILQAFVGVNLCPTMRYYNPAKGRRCLSFLVFCLRNRCLRERKRLADRSRFEGSVTKGIDGSEEGEEIDIQDPAPEHDPAQVTEHATELSALRGCIQALPNRYRVVIVLYYIEERTGKDIARILQISEENVRIRLYRARLKLLECLRKEGVLA